MPKDVNQCLKSHTELSEKCHSHFLHICVSVQMLPSKRLIIPFTTIGNPMCTCSLCNLLCASASKHKARRPKAVHVLFMATVPTPQNLRCHLDTSQHIFLFLKNLFYFIFFITIYALYTLFYLTPFPLVITILLPGPMNSFSLFFLFSSIPPLSLTQFLSPYSCQPALCQWDLGNYSI